MLNAVFGSKSIEKILLFLFVNQKCYGTQLSRFLQTPLTPIQKALAKLESAAIIKSSFEGKTKIYQFNPECPYLFELESLLKKIYTLLPAQEKKELHFFESKAPPEVKRNNFQLLFHLWERLSNVQHLTFIAKSRSNSGWQGGGKGDVTVIKENNGILLFREEGVWKADQGKQQIRFSNQFRWSFDRYGGMLSLEHLRYGRQRPVFLFHLVPKGFDFLESLDSHLCGEDTYFGQIKCDSKCIHLTWRIIGPKKNEHIDYFYT